MRGRHRTIRMDILLKVSSGPSRPVMMTLLFPAGDWALPATPIDLDYISYRQDTLGWNTKIVRPDQSIPLCEVCDVRWYWTTAADFMGACRPQVTASVTSMIYSGARYINVNWSVLFPCQSSGMSTPHPTLFVSGVQDAKSNPFAGADAHCTRSGISRSDPLADSLLQ